MFELQIFLIIKYLNPKIIQFMELTNNLCALDFGAWASKLAVLGNNRQFEVIVNEANFRQTPTVISFTNAQRLIGDQAVTKMKSNYMNTIRSPQRLIGITKKPHFLSQQLKYCTCKFRVADTDLLFEFAQGNNKFELSVEQLVIALITKMKSIYENNAISTDFLFMSIQSYLNNGQRKALKSCAQAAGFKNVSLVQEWECLAAQYSFVRQKDIQALTDDIIVIFVDLGYTNFFVHACLISKSKLSLLDQECLRYTGSRNIDILLAQFYFDMIKKQTGQDIQQNPKALVKLLQSVEIQRKKLSANTENQLVIECLLGDYDLSYNMTREQLQNISMPILAELASAMQSLRSRVQPIAPLHSVEIFGGVSRMPFIQEVVRTVFNIDPGKKMNASQSIARGCAIAGANRLGLLRNNACNLVRNSRHPIYLEINRTQPNGKLFYRNAQSYSKAERKIIFDKSSILPANSIVKIQGEGINQVLICQQGSMEINIIGYLSFKGTDNLTIFIDNDGIMRARLLKSNFESYDLGDLITVQKINKYREEQQKMKKRDSNILQSYEIRNQFQSLMYQTKANLNDKWKNIVSPEQKAMVLEILAENEKFLSDNSEHSTQNFKERIQTINALVDTFKGRK